MRTARHIVLALALAAAASSCTKDGLGVQGPAPVDEPGAEQKEVKLLSFSRRSSSPYVSIPAGYSMPEFSFVVYDETAGMNISRFGDKAVWENPGDVSSPYRLTGVTNPRWVSGNKLSFYAAGIDDTGLAEIAEWNMGAPEDYCDCRIFPSETQEDGWLFHPATYYTFGSSSSDRDSFDGTSVYTHNVGQLRIGDFTWQMSGGTFPYFYTTGAVPGLKAASGNAEHLVNELGWKTVSESDILSGEAKGVNIGTYNASTHPWTIAVRDASYSSVEEFTSACKDVRILYPATSWTESLGAGDANTVSTGHMGTPVLTVHNPYLSTDAVVATAKSSSASPDIPLSFTHVMSRLESIEFDFTSFKNILRERGLAAPVSDYYITYIEVSNRVDAEFRFDPVTGMVNPLPEPYEMGGSATEEEFYNLDWVIYMPSIMAGDDINMAGDDIKLCTRESIGYILDIYNATVSDFTANGGCAAGLQDGSRVFTFVKPLTNWTGPTECSEEDFESNPHYFGHPLILPGEHKLKITYAMSSASDPDAFITEGTDPVTGDGIVKTVELEGTFTVPQGASCSLHLSFNPLSADMDLKVTARLGGWINETTNSGTIAM